MARHLGFNHKSFDTSVMVLRQFQVPLCKAFSSSTLPIIRKYLILKIYLESLSFHIVMVYIGHRHQRYIQNEKVISIQLRVRKLAHGHLHPISRGAGT